MNQQNLSFDKDLKKIIYLPKLEGLVVYEITAA